MKTGAKASEALNRTMNAETMRYQSNQTLTVPERVKTEELDHSKEDEEEMKEVI